MGRRAVTSAEELTRGALRVVSSAGVAGLSSRAVAAEAGVALGTVYRHVPDLENLLLSAVEQVQAAFVRDLRAAAPDDRPLLPAVPRMAEAIVERVRTEPRLAELLAVTPRPGTATDGAGIRRWIAARVRRAVASGEIGATDPDTVAAAAFGLVRGVVEHALCGQASWPAVTAVLVTGLTGLLPSPSDT